MGARQGDGVNAVSLFAGVGGFDLALERAGVPVVAAVEIDKQASGVLAHRFPNTHLFSDVTEVTGEQLRAVGFDPSDGIICGGFPCQDLSVAGRRAGLAGRRSGLFFEIVRLLDDLQPRWTILENVPGLLSSNGGRDMGTVIGALGDSGYGVSYRVLDAQHFGVPQRRRRVFIVGCLGDNGSASAEVLAFNEGVRGGAAPSYTAGTELAGGAGDGPDVYGKTGFARYKRGGVKTLAATDYKRPEDNIVVGQGAQGAKRSGLRDLEAGGGNADPQ